MVAFKEMTENEDQMEVFPEQPDMVNRPPHYADRKYEVIDVLEDALTPEEFRGFLKGNALKYLLREGRKAGTPDVGKAGWYQQRLERHDEKCASDQNHTPSRGSVLDVTV